MLPGRNLRLDSEAKLVALMRLYNDLLMMKMAL